MFKLPAIFSLCLVLSIQGYSQIPEWKKSIRTTILNLAIDNQGNVISTGNFSGKVDFDPDSGVYYQEASGHPDAFISKVDSNGNFQWAFGFGGADYDWCYSATTDNLGNIYATGTFYGTADFDRGPNKFELTAFGNAIARDVFIIKLDPQGQLIWAKQIGGNGNDVGKFVSIDKYGDLVIVGESFGSPDYNPGPGEYYSSTSGTKTNIFILKLKKDGEFKWVKTYEASQAWVKDVFMDNFNIVISGMYEGSLNIKLQNSNTTVKSVEARDGFVLHLDLNGDFKKVKSIGGSGYDEITDATIDKNGNLYTVGFYEKTAQFDDDSLVSNGNNDAFISKYNKQGELLWLKPIEGVGNIEAHSILIDINGNLMIGGEFSGLAYFNKNKTVERYLNTTGNGNPAFLLKLDTIGNYIHVRQYGGNSLNNIETMDFGPNGKLYFSSEGRFNSCIWKLENCETQFGSAMLSDCKSRFSLSGDRTWTKSGVYMDYIRTAGGCDSILTINLTINRDTVIRNVSACKTYLSSYDNKTWNVSGKYSEIKSNGSSCDSLIITNLTLTKPDTVVSIKYDSISSKAIGVNYQWINCDKDKLIPGATKQSYKPLSSGKYRVEVDDNGCKDTSNCLMVEWLFTNEKYLTSKVSVFPNPTENSININLSEESELVEIAIFSSTGQLIEFSSHGNAQLINYPLNVEPGIYIVEIKTGISDLFRSRIIKK